MADTLDWSPLSLQATETLMSRLGAPWWIGGGWAIDLFLGKRTRTHADVDVALLRKDQDKLQALLKGWDVRIAMNGQLIPWKTGDWLEGGERWQFWARRRPEGPWEVEFLLEESLGDRWLYRRDPSVALPLARFGRTNQDGLPCVAPEVALLYKSNRLTEARNAADFESALPHLTQAARDWLRAALSIVQPGHPWISRLA